MARFLGAPCRSCTGKSAQGSRAWPTAGAQGVARRPALVPLPHCWHGCEREPCGFCGPGAASLGCFGALRASFPDIFYLRGGGSLRSVPSPLPPFHPPTSLDSFLLHLCLPTHPLPWSPAPTPAPYSN